MRKESIDNSGAFSFKSQPKSKHQKQINKKSLQKQNLQLSIQMQRMKENFESLEKAKISVEAQNSKLRQKIDSLETTYKYIAQKQTKFNREKFELLSTFGLQHTQVAKAKYQDIQSFKEMLIMLVSLLKQGSIESERFQQILSQISKVTSEFINTIQSPQFTQKIADLRSLSKINKNEMMNQLRKNLDQEIKKANIEEKQLIEIERVLIKGLSEKIKHIKETSKSREEVYSKHIQLLEKQIKENEIAYQLLKKECQRQIQKLKQKNTYLLAVYNKEIQIPFASLNKKVQAQIQLIKIQFQKANSSNNIKDVTNQLISVINRYLKQRQDQEAQLNADCNKLNMQKLDEVCEKLNQIISRIGQTLIKKNSMRQQINQFINMKVRQEQDKNREQKKLCNLKQLQTKSTYQHEYIVMLQKYQNKLESCIKRMSAGSRLENEWKKEKQEYYQRRFNFEVFCRQVKESNEKVVSQLIQLKKTQFKIKNQTSELKGLFEQFSNEIQLLKNFREEVMKFIESQRNLKKLIHEQTYKFNSIFMEHYSNLIDLKESIPVTQNPAVHQSTQMKEKNQKQIKQFGKAYLELKKGYEQLARSKKIVQTRLSKGISQILKIHQQYLKFARSKKQSINLNIDQKILNSNSNRIFMKLEEIFGTLRHFKECFLKIESQSKSNYQNSKNQIKKLANYMRSTKIEQSITHLVDVIEKDEGYLDKMIHLLDNTHRKQ